MHKKVHGYITLGILSTVVALSSVWYVISPTVTEAQKVSTNEQDPTVTSVNEAPFKRTGKYVVVHLDTMTLDMFDGETIVKTIPVISQGKPKSYYETIGGEYPNDYKIPNHFSSIGHVYMPWSIHVFGNYFIHGIPYYPDGTKVSSTYSGGCVRLSDDDAKEVYNFIQKGTPIIITRDDKDSFARTATSAPARSEMDMTRLMVATISLEFLTQDNEIYDTHGELTTRRTLIPKLLADKDDSISTIYAQALGEATFVGLMNAKARALGLTNTTFTSTQTPVSTTDEDYLRFMKYIDTYKFYLRKVSNQVE